MVPGMVQEKATAWALVKAAEMATPWAKEMAQVKVAETDPVTVPAREQAMATMWDCNRSSLEDPNIRLGNSHKSHQMAVEACYKHYCQSKRNYPGDHWGQPPSRRLDTRQSNSYKMSARQKARGMERETARRSAPVMEREMAGRSVQERVLEMVQGKAM
jgi:hypothetical protein